MVKINPINKNYNQKTNSKNNTTNSKYKQKFTNKSSNNTNSIERKSVGTEEQATLEKEMFDRSWNVFFRNVDKFPAQRNISAVGAILRPYRETGLDDYKVLGLMKRSGTLLKQNPSSDNINLVNVIYSTAIKCINPDNLINGELKDKNFAKLVDTSIHIYRKYPLGGDIDYRHILGRMVSFKDISERIFSQKHYNMPPELKRVEWSESRQLDFISTIERILQQYENISKNFVTTIDSPKAEKNDTTTQVAELKENYFTGLFRLFKTMAKNAWIMMQEPIKNKDEIQDKIDLAKYYLNKIPYSDTDKMNKAWRVVHSFTLLEKNLQEAISKNKPSRMLKRMR